MLLDLARAYGATRAALDPREQEADIIRRVTFGLRDAKDRDDDLMRVKAMADNRRLWLAMESALLHPSNQLPQQMRAGLISLGRLVQRETAGDGWRRSRHRLPHRGQRAGRGRARRQRLIPRGPRLRRRVTARRFASAAAPSVRAP